jgi:hypothetical protein
MTMRKPGCRLLIALLCWATLGGTSCRKTIDASQARAIAGTAVAVYARGKSLSPGEFELTQVDDSGKVVDWFYEFRSTARAGRIVTVLVDRRGGFEAHHSSDDEEPHSR